MYYARGLLACLLVSRAKGLLVRLLRAALLTVACLIRWCLRVYHLSSIKGNGADAGSARLECSPGQSSALALKPGVYG